MTGAFPAAYGSEAMVKALKGDDNRLLLGVTGSIATGKSTVAKMLEELGAPMIDFDVLSRIVVEPHKPAWQDIVSHFGEQVLLEDETLDREKLREVVFQDMEQRKKLESFTHPRIGEEFFKLIDLHTREKKDPIIQVVIPLLIETNMQAMFDNLLMVYVPEEEQVKRLIKRDGIAEELAMKIIRSQMSVEEKKGYCDLFIDNSGTVEETHEKVTKLWEELKQAQNRRAKKGRAGKKG